MKKIYLARHGQTNWNLEGRTQGIKDSQLTDLGYDQAKRLGERLRKLRIDAIYSSPLKRAEDTAKIISHMIGINYHSDSLLMEMNFGLWEGLTMGEINERYYNELRDWRNRPHHAIIPQGENLQKVQHRIIDFMEKKVLQSEDESILIISHSTTIRLFLLHILSMDLCHYYKLKQSNCALNLVEYREYGPVLVKYNDTCHLDIMLER